MPDGRASARKVSGSTSSIELVNVGDRYRQFRTLSHWAEEPTSSCSRTINRLRSHTSAPSVLRSASGSCWTPAAAWTAEKIKCRAVALERLLFDLLGDDDEVFLYRFDNSPHLVQGWTTDRNLIRDELRRLPTDGATALYDAVAQALPLLESGRHRKKALLVISDGNDTSSKIDLPRLKADSRIGGARLRDWNRRPAYQRNDRKRPSRYPEIRAAKTAFPDAASVSRSESPPRTAGAGTPPGTAPPPRQPRTPPSDEPGSNSAGARRGDGRSTPCAARRDGRQRRSHGGPAGCEDPDPRPHVSRTS